MTVGAGMEGTSRAIQMIIGAFSELSRVGGIQQVSRHSGATLWELAGERGERCELLGLNDPKGEGWFAVGPGRYPFRGFARNKLGLVAHLLMRARQTSLVVAGHVHLGPAVVWPAMLHPGMRWWVMAHGFEVWEPLRWYRRAALRRASGILAVSCHTAEAVERAQGIARERIFLLPLAIDPSFGAASSAPVRWPAPAGSLSLLTVARLSTADPGKGIDNVIRVLPQLLRSFPNLYHVIVGGGDAQPAYEELTADCGVRERVFFCGELPVGSLRGYYDAADIFVMPSRQEGFGIVYLEAMAAGKPIVAAASGGSTEVVDDGQTGFLVDYADAAALANRLLRLLADADLRRRMGEEGRRKVVKEHQYEFFRDRLKAYLRAKA
ncbi:MAG TPA: glycosyltransferase family 4 protein [Candidatus Acidoferrales bacterium]|nr:glycosyltransferase family 4 protein [Candidatus Acidoferrales bacterium]